MPAIARLGDTSDHGGAITSASPNVFCNGIAVARQTDSFLCPIHGAQTITSITTRTYANSLLVATIGATVSCGATITTGSPNTFAET